MRAAPRTVALVVALLAAGCASETKRKKPTSKYDWGAYDERVYRMYVRADEFDPAEDARKLAEQIDATLNDGFAVPPGLQAHVGMLLAAAGDRDAAAARFEAEKSAFPESAAFMDAILARMSK